MAILHSDSFPTDRDFCDIEFRLGEEEMDWIWPISKLRKMRSRSRQGEAGEVSGGNGIEDTAENSILYMCHRIFVGEGLIQRVNLSGALKEWLTKFRPQMIYSRLGSLPFIRLSRMITEFTGVPLAVHIMDDWVETSYERGLVAPYFRRQIQREFEEIVRLSTLRIAICPMMARAYEKRYGFPFIDYMNTIDVADWEMFSRKEWEAKDTFRLVYSGALIPNSALDSIRDLCRAVSNLHASGMDIELALHCPAYFVGRYREELENPPCVQVCNPPEHETIASIFASSDLLVLPVNFDRESVRYIRYSMPGKVPAYLGAGTPILVYGPREVASVEYAEREGWGHVVSERSIESLEKAIREIATDMELRKKLALRGKEVVLKNHDAIHVRSAFQGELAGGAGVLTARG